MSSKMILAVLLAASLAGNASYLITTVMRRPAARAGAIERLGLSTEQTEKVDGSLRAFDDQRRMAHREMATLRSRLASEFAKEAPDRRRMAVIAAEMAQVQTGMRPKLIDHLLAIHALLTPAQRASFADLMRVAGGRGAGCPGGALYPVPKEER